MSQGWNLEAKPEYATAKIAVWWDMNDCPIPVGYDARRVRPSIEREFKKLGYSGPVSITAYGDQKPTPDHLLRGLSSTGVAVAHTIPKSRCSLMFSDMVEWRGHNPPPATMMIISNQVEDIFSWDLARLQQESKYNLFLAYPVITLLTYSSLLVTSAVWLWKELLDNKHEEEEEEEEEEKEEEVICSATFCCKSCNFDWQSVRRFRKHLSSRGHALEEARNSTPVQLAPVTRMWGRNYLAKPEYATAKIAVWWDMNDCPIPVGYDPRQVRPSIEGAFKNLGYSGPVSITGYGDQTQTPDHLLRGLSSTGVDVVHAICQVRCNRMFSDLLKWRRLNPLPATMMLISDHVEDLFSRYLTSLQQVEKYNLFLAYSFRPYKMSVLVTSAEWLWDSLLAGSETRRHVLQRCSSMGESPGMFYCKSCFCDCKSLDHLREHLSTKEHAWKEFCIHERIRVSEYDRLRMPWIKEEDFPKSKRLRKAFRTGFRPFHNHLHLTNR